MIFVVLLPNLVLPLLDNDDDFFFLFNVDGPHMLLTVTNSRIKHFGKLTTLLDFLDLSLFASSVLPTLTGLKNDPKIFLSARGEPERF